MRKYKKKATAITAVVAAAALFLSLGAYAVFSDVPTDTSTFGRNGTVDIQVSDLDFDVNEKKVNINPGDGDPYAPGVTDARYREGTEHVLEYHVENLGTKSVRTRHLITLTMKDTNSNVVEPSPMMISVMENAFLHEVNNTQSELAHKYYCLENGKRIEVTETEAFYVDGAGNRIKRIGDCSTEPSKENHDKMKLDSRIIKIQYLFISDVFNGVSKQEHTAEIEQNNNKTGADYVLYLGMYHEAETNAYYETSRVYKDNKMYLLDGLRFSEAGQIMGTEVKKVLHGYWKDASETAPDGKMYLAADTKVNGTNITGTEIVYIDMNYLHAGLQAVDGKMYLTKNFSTTEDGRPRGTVVEKRNGRYYKKGTNTEVKESEIVHWEADPALTALNGKMYLKEGLVFNGDMRTHDHTEVVDGEEIDIYGTEVYKNNDNGKYYNAVTNQEVAITDIATWDVPFRIVRNDNPRYYYYTNDKKTEWQEVSDTELVHWKKNGDTVTYSPVYVGEDKYIRSDTGATIQEEEIARWDTAYNMIRPTEDIGGNEHEKLGNEGAKVTVDIEIQAQQFRNTTNDDWSDWTTYYGTSKDYEITPEYLGYAYGPVE